MLRRLLHLVLDHEAVRLREENRALEDQLVQARQNTNTVIREQNEYIDQVREDARVASNERMNWRDAAIRIARDLGATVDERLNPPPGIVIDLALQAIRRLPPRPSECKHERTAIVIWNPTTTGKDDVKAQISVSWCHCGAIKRAFGYPDGNGGFAWSWCGQPPEWELPGRYDREAISVDAEHASNRR